MDKSSSNNESASFKLPEVQPDQNTGNLAYESGVKQNEENSMSKAIEQNAPKNSISSINTQQNIPLSVDPSVIADQSSVINTTQTPTKINVSDDLPANDVDLIEKAWVIKAKAIVEQTKNDPYEQTNEINKIREDYQSKRFNTKLKIDTE